MSVLKREDGIRFATQTYREVLVSKRTSLMKDEVRSLAREHGEYVRFFIKNNEQVEVIFSKEPGFLLGESVWHHFNRPADLIYCEVLPDKTHAIAVVVRGSTVYLDIRTPLNAIEDEISSFITGANQYHVYVYGDVPLSDVPDAQKYVIPQAALASFSKLTESVFEKLPADESLQLQALSLALRTQKLGKASLLPFVLAAGVVVIGIAAWWYWSAGQEEPVMEEQPIIERPFAAYENTLVVSASPSNQIADLINTLALLYRLPGWELTTLNFKDFAYSAIVKPQTNMSSLLILENWLKQQDFSFTVEKDKVSFRVPSRLEHRQYVPEIPNLDEVLARMRDKINRMLPLGGGMSIEGDISRSGSTREAKVKVDFSTASPNVLLLVGRELAKFPVVVKEITLAVSNNLLSGSLQLTVLGK